LNLLRLSAFVDRQIFAVLADPAPERLQSIIDVNLSLAAGLRKKSLPPEGQPIAEVPPSRPTAQG
jgi:hypothetical protein